MTLRQQKLTKTLGESRTREEALLKAGYAPSTAHQQTNVLEKAKGFKELIAQYLPIEDAFKATKDGLKATKFIPRPDEPSVVLPDHAIRLKASEQIYKLHGVITPDQAHVGDNVTINILNYGAGDNIGNTELTQSNGNNPEPIQIQSIELAPQSSQDYTVDGAVD